MNREFQKTPVKAGILVPLMDLGKLLTHKQKLLSWMAQHKTVSRPQILCFPLQRITRHLADHRAFPVNHLVMRQYKNKILAVSVEHTERQLTVMVFSEIRIALHIAGKIIHPAHIPFIIEAKSIFLYVLCDFRPCSRFLRNQDSAVFSSFKYGI